MSAGPTGDGTPSPEQGFRNLSPSVTPTWVAAEKGAPHKDAAPPRPAVSPRQASILPALLSPFFFPGRRKEPQCTAIAGVTAHGFLGGLGTYLAHLWIGVFIVEAGLPRVFVSVFFAALTACRLIATWFAESALLTLRFYSRRSSYS